MTSTYGDEKKGDGNQEKNNTQACQRKYAKESYIQKNKTKQNKRIYK
jgi:hypothetical protein